MTTVGQAQRRRDRRRRVALLVGSVALVVAFGAQLVLLIPTTYTATSAVALRPLSADVPADTVELLTHEYGVAIGSRETAELVRKDASWASSAQVSVRTVQDLGTATLRIVVTSTSRTMAIDVANALARHAVALGGDDTTTSVVQTVGAGAAGVSVTPPRHLYLGVLLCLGGLVLTGGLYRIRARSS